MLKSILSLFYSPKNKKQNIWLNRNDSCWCGSGQKYKKCHLNADEPQRKKEKPTACITG